MNSTQIYEGILNGDVDVTYFQGWLHEAVQSGYIEGFSDGCKDSVREAFEAECG